MQRWKAWRPTPYAWRWARWIWDLLYLGVVVPWIAVQIATLFPRATQITMTDLVAAISLVVLLRGIEGYVVDAVHLVERFVRLVRE